VSVYLDWAASAPVRPEVAAAYAEALAVVGNPSSVHAHGRAARAMLEDARERLAAALDAEPVEITFTSGGTESVNTAIKGLWWASGADGGRGAIVSTPAEHHATLDALEWLAAQGAEVRLVDVDADARIDLAALESALSAGPVALVTALWANNELGTIEHVDEVARIAADAGVPVHWDAVAAFGHTPVSFRGSGAAALSISGHKFGAPIGTGALAVRRGATPVPLIHGGAQQPARSGTIDVPGAVALALAAELAIADLEGESARLAALQERLEAGIRAAVPDARVSGAGERLPGHVHVVIPGLLGETLLFLLDQEGYSVSVGSACRAGVAEPSHVLLATGASEADARATLRLTLGRTTTQADVGGFLAVLPSAVERARAAR